MAYGRLANIGELTTSIGTYNNKTILLTMDNIVCLCGRILNVTAAANATIFKVPDFAKPNVTLYFNIAIASSGNIISKIFIIDTSGNFKCLEALNNVHIFCDGINYNINGKFYSAAIGNNNTSTMTYPIGRL